MTLEDLEIYWGYCERFSSLMKKERYERGTLLVAFLLRLFPCCGHDVLRGGSCLVSLKEKPRVQST